MVLRVLLMQILRAFNILYINNWVLGIVLLTTPPESSNRLFQGYVRLKALVSTQTLRRRSPKPQIPELQPYEPPMKVLRETPDPKP